MSKLIGFGALILIAATFGFGMLLEPESSDQQLLFMREEGRRSITFIMGEDKTTQTYYQLAASHFALDAFEKTDDVIHTCRTLSGVISYLNTSSGRGHLPWSVINIVAHGNPQTGLNLYISEQGHKATPKRLVQAALRGDTPAFEEGVIDASTRINFWSCGIGKSPLMRMALKRIFSPASGDSAQVYCSPHFVIFHPAEKTAAARCLKASYWPYYFRRGRPGNLEIAHALRTQYPDEPIDWRQALEHRQRSDSNSVYHGEYHIPVSYTRIYGAKAERPVFRNREDKIQWALSQTAVIEQIEESGIPQERFHWTVNKIIYTTEDGRRVPAVKAIGMATVLYVLREE